VSQLRARFGDDRLEAILVGGNAPAPVGLCVDIRFANAESVVTKLASHEIAAHVSPYARDAVVLVHTASTTLLESYLGSSARLQGEAALFPVDLLDPQPGETILDLCSGRGNKTRQIVARMGDTGAVEAVELDARKAADLAAHLRDEGITSAVVFQRDAAFIDDQAEPADRALVDAPCSGIGIVGRQPEARWRKSPEDAARLAPQQLAILEAAAMRLRAGGTLVYSVCSTDPREGDDVIAAFLAIQPAFERVPLPERYAPFATPLGDVLVPPGIDGRDGFFVARLRRA
jgi:16S rRNA (cytosine967-C5)-methyltransferase